MVDWTTWPGRTPPTPAILRVMKAMFVISEDGTGCDPEEVRDLLITYGMTKDEALRAMEDAEECGIAYFGEGMN